jgi:hypothetical protein
MAAMFGLGVGFRKVGVVVLEFGIRIPVTDLASE